MFVDSPAVERLIDALRALPSVGRRSAERMALHLLSGPDEVARNLATAISEAKDRITTCSECGMLTEGNPCRICTDERRCRNVLCVVERTTGVLAIEQGGTYHGLYHVLNGALSPLDGIGPAELRMDRLMARVSGCGIEEVIVATNATPEGEATAMYLARELGHKNISVTRIAHGVPMGGGLEYADSLTLNHALEGRTRMTG